jgi:hypothetical protein
MPANIVYHQDYIESVHSRITVLASETNVRQIFNLINALLVPRQFYSSRYHVIIWLFFLPGDKSICHTSHFGPAHSKDSKSERTMHYHVRLVLI